MAERSVSQIQWSELLNRKFYPSPRAWEDEVLYFLLLDRFSDGKEKDYQGNVDGDWIRTGETLPYTPSDYGNAVKTEESAAAWRNAGGSWVGKGTTIRGLSTKMGYLRRMGITTIWVSPPLRQVAGCDSYHGYGIQDFLDVDPRFGTRDELRQMVATAHENGIRVVLDIVLNHTGDVFNYHPDRYWTPDGMDPRWDGNDYEWAGFREGQVWPQEMQNPDAFMRKGHVTNWDYWPEYEQGDFCSLKKIRGGSGPIDSFQPSNGFMALCQAYRFWMLFLDLDGYRIDTVKHLDKGAARFFAWFMHESAQAIGKDNFYLIGEITGGRSFAFDTLELVGLDAALGIDDVQAKLCDVVKGWANPEDYFGLFRNSVLVGKESHAWFRDKVVTQIDDHDKVPQGGHKARFCAPDRTWTRLVLNALALNVTTLGIPCIYYGTEQGLDGEGDSDRYLREAMYGGAFGAFRSAGRHVFNENTPAYQEIAKIIKVRQAEPALRRGRQYLREISVGEGSGFGLPRRIGDGRMLSIVPWSRILVDTEILVAMNTDYDQARTAWVAVDPGLHPKDSSFGCLYSSDHQTSTRYAVQLVNGRPAIQLTVPAAGFVILK